MVEQSVSKTYLAKEDDSPDGVTRREALARFVLVMGGAALGSSVAPALAGSSPGASAAGMGAGSAPNTAAVFNARRAKIFQSLLPCYDGRSPIALTAERDLAAEMVERYRTRGPEYGQYVDTLLDAVDSAPTGARFADQGLVVRKAILHEWHTAKDADDDLALQGRRPSDSEGPTDIRERNAWLAEKIKAFTATLSPEDIELDPKTMMPRFMGRLPTPPKPKLPAGGPLDTPVRLRRHLDRSSYLLLASFFVDDPYAMRHL